MGRMVALESETTMPEPKHQHPETVLVMRTRHVEALCCHFGGDQHPRSWPHGLYEPILRDAVAKLAESIYQQPVVVAKPIAKRVCPDCSGRGCPTCEAILEESNPDLTDRFDFFFQ